MTILERDDYRVFRFGLVVYGVAASTVEIAVFAFVARYIPVLATGDHANFLSQALQLLGSFLIVFELGITGSCEGQSRRVAQRQSLIQDFLHPRS
jgi:hypothetical protein